MQEAINIVSGSRDPHTRRLTNVKLRIGPQIIILPIALIQQINRFIEIAEEEEK